MTRPEPSRERFDHVASIFGDAAFVRELGIVLRAAGDGWCETALEARDVHLQQHGFVHAGVITTLADHTCGGAARAAVPRGLDVITIEFKINFLKPVIGRSLVAAGQTLRAGKTIVVAESEVFVVVAEARTLVAKCVSTLAVIPQGQKQAEPG